MSKPGVRLVGESPIENTYRQKFWNTSINVLGMALIVCSFMVWLFTLLPLGAVYGLTVNQFPRWASLYIFAPIIKMLPTDDEGIWSRPFYRKR